MLFTRHSCKDGIICFGKQQIPDTNLLYFKYWYVPKGQVSYMVDYVSDAKFLDYQSRLVRGTITASSIVATGGFSLPAAFVSGIGVFAITESIDFKSSVINKIKTAGGYNSSTRTYSKGVLLKEVVSNGITYYFVESWNGGTMYGPAGWTGKWTTTYNNY